MQKIIAGALAAVAFLALTPCLRAQQGFFTRDDVIKYTPDWQGERFPDGRPKVPDDILDRMKNVTLEEAWATLRSGIDLSSDVIATARQIQDRAARTDVVFEQASVYELPFADGTFDVVYAHQVLQHLSEPVTALYEMRRVLREGGLLAVRDGDYGAFAWAPDDQRLDRWMAIYQQ